MWPWWVSRHSVTCTVYMETNIYIEITSHQIRSVLPAIEGNPHRAAGVTLLLVGSDPLPLVYFVFKKVRGG